MAISQPAYGFCRLFRECHGSRFIGSALCLAHNVRHIAFGAIINTAPLLLFGSAGRNEARRHGGCTKQAFVAFQNQDIRTAILCGEGSA